MTAPREHRFEAWASSAARTLGVWRSPRITVAASLAIALCVAPTSVATAQPRAGVPLVSILAPGERVLGVDAPDAWELPARVRIACDASEVACARLDVWVCESAEDAEARLTAALATSTTVELEGRTGLGDRARADAATGRASIVIARRDNVVFAVRALNAGADAAAIAARVDAATLAARRGDARATRGAATGVLADPGEGGSVVLRAPPAVLDVHVTASGSATARRTPEGWLVTRALGPFELFAWYVDDQLRVGNISIALDHDASETIRHPLGR